jgi:hypothetical protein
MSWLRKLFGRVSPSESQPLDTRCAGARCDRPSMRVVFVAPAGPYGIHGDFIDRMFSRGCRGCCQCRHCVAFYSEDCIDMDKPCGKCGAISSAEGFFLPGTD